MIIRDINSVLHREITTVSYKKPYVVPNHKRRALGREMKKNKKKYCKKFYPIFHMIVEYLVEQYNDSYGHNDSSDYDKVRKIVKEHEMYSGSLTSIVIPIILDCIMDEKQN